MEQYSNCYESAANVYTCVYISLSISCVSCSYNNRKQSVFPSFQQQCSYCGYSYYLQAQHSRTAQILPWWFQRQILIFFLIDLIWRTKYFLPHILFSILFRRIFHSFYLVSCILVLCRPGSFICLLLGTIYLAVTLDSSKAQLKGYEGKKPIIVEYKPADACLHWTILF